MRPGVAPALVTRTRRLRSGRSVVNQVPLGRASPRPAVCSLPPQRRDLHRGPPAHERAARDRALAEGGAPAGSSVEHRAGVAAEVQPVDAPIGTADPSGARSDWRAAPIGLNPIAA